MRDLEKDRKTLESYLEIIFQPPKVGSKRSFWWHGYLYHCIVGKGIVSVNLGDGSELSEEEQETAKTLWHKHVAKLKKKQPN